MGERELGGVGTILIDRVEIFRCAQNDEGEQHVAGGAGLWQIPPWAKIRTNERTDCLTRIAKENERRSREVITSSDSLRSSSVLSLAGRREICPVIVTCGFMCERDPLQLRSSLCSTGQLGLGWRNERRRDFNAGGELDARS